MPGEVARGASRMISEEVEDDRLLFAVKAARLLLARRAVARRTERGGALAGEPPVGACASGPKSVLPVSVSASGLGISVPCSSGYGIGRHRRSRACRLPRRSEPLCLRPDRRKAPHGRYGTNPRSKPLTQPPASWHKIAPSVAFGPEFENPGRRASARSTVLLCRAVM
jgi:hypothetical protein